MMDAILSQIPIFWLLCGCVAVQLADLITTYMAIQFEGTSEGWAPTKWVMSKVGTLPGLVLIKGAMMAAPVAVWQVYGEAAGQVEHAQAILVAVIIAYLVVPIRGNVMLYLKLSREGRAKKAKI